MIKYNYIIWTNYLYSIDGWLGWARKNVRRVITFGIASKYQISCDRVVWIGSDDACGWWLQIRLALWRSGAPKEGMCCRNGGAGGTELSWRSLQPFYTVWRLGGIDGLVRTRTEREGGRGGQGGRRIFRGSISQHSTILSLHAQEYVWGCFPKPYLSCIIFFIFLQPDLNFFTFSFFFSLLFYFYFIFIFRLPLLFFFSSFSPSSSSATLKRKKILLHGHKNTISLLSLDSFLKWNSSPNLFILFMNLSVCVVTASVVLTVLRCCFTHHSIYHS